MCLRLVRRESEGGDTTRQLCLSNTLTFFLAGLFVSRCLTCLLTPLLVRSLRSNSFCLWQVGALRSLPRSNSQMMDENDVDEDKLDKRLGLNT